MKNDKTEEEKIVNSHLIENCEKNVSQIRTVVNKLLSVSDLINAQNYISRYEFMMDSENPLYSVEKRIYMNWKLKEFLSECEFFLDKFPNR